MNMMTPTPWRQQTLRFSSEVAQVEFGDAAVCDDGELELHLERTTPADPARARVPEYKVCHARCREYAGEICLRIGDTFELSMYLVISPTRWNRLFAARSFRRTRLPPAASAGTGAWDVDALDHGRSRQSRLAPHL